MVSHDTCIVVFCTLIFNWFGCNLFYFLFFVCWFISFFFSARHEICVYYDKGFLSLFSSHFFLLFFILSFCFFFFLLKKHEQTRAARNDISSREREEGDSGEVDRLLNKNVQSVPLSQYLNSILRTRPDRQYF